MIRRVEQRVGMKVALLEDWMAVSWAAQKAGSTVAMKVVEMAVMMAVQKVVRMVGRMETIWVVKMGKLMVE